MFTRGFVVTIVYASLVDRDSDMLRLVEYKL